MEAPRLGVHSVAPRANKPTTGSPDFRCYHPHQTGLMRTAFDIDLAPRGFDPEAVPSVYVVPRQAGSQGAADGKGTKGRRAGYLATCSSRPVLWPLPRSNEREARVIVARIRAVRSGDKRKEKMNGCLCIPCYKKKQVSTPAAAKLSKKPTPLPPPPPPPPSKVQGPSSPSSSFLQY
ncbi:hypothetical protein HU200_007023 [Digitaria exilis]|uniref:Uncharacterized protein n=1 Tax=Digitaria exilis TaxID=1010633 RepID=A0A835ENU7_9POAL|nr:hypothetical protein HU200_036670 [Digitaria exilis]KAF8769008.1 hypothetical protein HU200_007023 [Digitaria exilis]